MTLFLDNERKKPQLRRHIEDIKDRYDVEGRVVQVTTRASTAPGISTLQSGSPMTDTYSRSRCTQ